MSSSMNDINAWVTKLTNPDAAEDLNNFLEGMPKNTSNTFIYLVTIIWLCAGMAGVYANMQLQSLTELRAELENVSALSPSLPKIKNNPINANDVKKFVEKAKQIYPDLRFKSSGAKITISANTTAYFGQFREAVGHVQNGGSGWRVAIDKFCVGRECKREPLAATLKINKVSVTRK